MRASECARRTITSELNYWLSLPCKRMKCMKQIQIFFALLSAGLKFCIHSLFFSSGILINALPTTNARSLNECISEWMNQRRPTLSNTVVPFFATRRIFGKSKTNTDCGQNGKSMDSIHSICRRWTSCIFKSISFFFRHSTVFLCECRAGCARWDMRASPNRLLEHDNKNVTRQKRWPFEIFLIYFCQLNGTTKQSIYLEISRICRAVWVWMRVESPEEMSSGWMVSLASSCSCLTRPKCVGERTRQCVGCCHGFVLILSSNTAWAAPRTLQILSHGHNVYLNTRISNIQ